MARHVVGRVEEIPEGDRKIVELEGRSIGVFNVKGTFYALRNRCPHQGAPLGRGRLTGTMLPSKPGEYLPGRDGEVLRCPWHGWEFDVTNGQSIFNPHRTRVKAYEVSLVDGSTLGEEDPSVESYPVTVEGMYVVVEL